MTQKNKIDPSLWGQKPVKKTTKKRKIDDEIRDDELDDEPKNSRKNSKKSENSPGPIVQPKIIDQMEIVEFSKFLQQEDPKTHPNPQLRRLFPHGNFYYAAVEGFIGLWNEFQLKKAKAEQEKKSDGTA